MRKNRDFLVFLLLGLGFVWGCKPRKPDYVLPESKMEKILYDYHKASAAAVGISRKDVPGRSPYEAYVFGKNGVTKAEFDSSYAWYSRHTELLVGIYEGVKKRVDSESEVIDGIVRQRGSGFVKSVEGDSVDIWGAERRYVLSCLPDEAQLAFTEEADTSFHRGDKYTFSACYELLGDTARQKVQTMLAVTYDNDSVDIASSLVTHSGSDSISLVLSSERNPRKINLCVTMLSAPPLGEGACLLMKHPKFVRERAGLVNSASKL